MNVQSTSSEIRKLITELLNAKLVLDYNYPVVANDGNGQLVTWSSATSLSTTFDISTIKEFRRTIKERWYSLLMFDGAAIQISYLFKNGVLQKHRLCYFPCPVFFEQEDIAELGILDLLDFVTQEDLDDRLRIEGPVRFDFDLSAGTTEHPPSHLTISRSSSRVPVSYALSVGHFMKFVFENFYPNHEDVSTEWKCEDLARCLPPMRENRLYIDWNR